VDECLDPSPLDAIGPRSRRQHDPHPDPRTERHDANGGKRAATAQEIADYDDMMLDDEIKDEFDTKKAMKALVLWIAPFVNKTPAQAKSELRAIYKSL